MKMKCKCGNMSYSIYSQKSANENFEQFIEVNPKLDSFFNPKQDMGD